MSLNSEKNTFQKVAVVYGEDAAHSTRLLEYLNKGWFSPSTPILANAPEDKFLGGPISCFLSEVMDGPQGAQTIYEETMQLSSLGAGLGTSWSNWKSIFEENEYSSGSHGVLPFIRGQGNLMRLMGGKARKIGSLAAYLHVSHPDIEDFIVMRKNAQGIDPESKIPRYIHHGVVIPDAFMEAVLRNEKWTLYDTQKKPIRSLPARDLWLKILTTRTETGEPYLVFEDTVNRTRAEHHKRLGLEIHMSNLCTEITLPTGRDHLGKWRTAICCLSSVNLAKFYEWHQHEYFIEDIARFLDNVLSFFIVECIDKELGDPYFLRSPSELRKLEIASVKKAFDSRHPMRHAVYSAFRSRDIGVGAAGLHTLFQSLGIPFDSLKARELNKQIFELIRRKFDEASLHLATERGACPDSAEGGTFERFSYKLAIAPTTKISSYLGVSRCIEPAEPVYVSKDTNGFNMLKNSHLTSRLQSLNLDNERTWNLIASGGLESILGAEEAKIYDGPYSIPSSCLIDMAVDRPVDQAQSLNLFLPTPMSKNDLVRIHISAWQKGVKTLYYLYGQEKISVSRSLNVELDSEKPPIICEDEICVVCQ